MSSKILAEKPAQGEMLLWERWIEYQSGYQDEITEGARLEVSPKGEIVLVEYSKTTSFAPRSSGGSSNQHRTVISVTDLISAIKKASEEHSP